MAASSSSRQTVASPSAALHVHAVPLASQVVPIPTRGARLRFVAAAMAMLAVCGTLALLAWKTANPVVISPAQLALADEIIVGQVVATGEHRVRVLEVIKGGLEADQTIRVINLPPAAAVANTSYLLALSPFRRDYQVTILNNRGIAPPEILIYPATPETIAHARQLLSR